MKIGLPRNARLFSDAIPASQRKEVDHPLFPYAAALRRFGIKSADSRRKSVQTLMEKFHLPDTRSRGKNAEKKTNRVNQHENNPKTRINA